MTESKETESDSFMGRLPQEIVEFILLDKQLALEDVFNFSFTCKRFHLYSRNSKVWKIKCCEKWPSVRENSWLLSVTKTRGEWHNEALNFLSIEKQLMLDIKEKSKDDCLRLTFRVEDLFHCAPSFDIRLSLRVPIMIDELAAYLNDPSNANLSHRYHARLMFRFLKRKYLFFKYDEVLLKLPPKEYTLEKFMVFLSEWLFIDEHISQTKIFSMLDNILRRVEENLKKLNSSHSLFKVHNSTRKEWRVRNIEGNQFSFEESRQILFSMLDILFGELGFTVIKWDHFMNEANNKKYSSIDEVLKYKIGHPMVISAIFVIIARQFGVVCESSLDNVLHWRNATSHGKSECFSITLNEVHDRNNPSLVFDSSRNNLIKSCHGGCNHAAVSFQQIGDCFKFKVGFVEFEFDRLFPLHALFHSQLLSCYWYCDELRSSNPEGIYALARSFPERDQIVKYAVGMFACYKNSRGVITGWIYPLNGSLYDNRIVPRYNILLDNSDDVQKFIVQDQLSSLGTSEIKEIKSDLIGKYFSEFKGLYYQPTEGLEKLYPDDFKVRELYAENCLKNADNKGKEAI